MEVNPQTGNAQNVCCSLCGETFLAPQHFDAHHCPVVKKTLCTCGKEFLKSTDFVAHFGSQHVSGTQCLVCMETVAVESEKDEHWLSHGEEEIVQRQMLILPQPAVGTATVTANPTSDMQRMLDHLIQEGQWDGTTGGRGENNAAAHLQHIPQQQKSMGDVPSTSRQIQMPSSSNTKEPSEPVISCKRARLETPQHQHQIPHQPSPQCHNQPGPSTQQQQPLPQYFLVQQPGPSTQQPQQHQPPSYLTAVSPPFRPMYNSPSFPQGMMQFLPQYQQFNPQSPTPFHPSMQQYLAQLQGAPNYPQLQQQLLQGFPSPQQAFPPPQQQRMPQIAVNSPMNHPQFVGFHAQTGPMILNPNITPLTHPHRFQQQQPTPQPAPQKRTRTRKAPQPQRLPLPQQQQEMSVPFPNPTIRHAPQQLQQQGVHQQQVIVPPPPYPVGMQNPHLHQYSHPSPPPQVVRLPPTAPPTASIPAPTPTPVAPLPPAPPPPVINPHPTILEMLLAADSDEEVQPAAAATSAVAAESSMPLLVPEPACDSLQMPATSSNSSSTALQDAAAAAATTLQPPAEVAAVPHPSEDPIEDTAMTVPTAPDSQQQPASAAEAPHPAETADAASEAEATAVPSQPPAAAVQQPTEICPTENLPEKLARIKEEVADDVTLHHVDASSLIGTLSAFLKSPADLASLGASEAASIDDLFKRYELLKKQAAGASEAAEDEPGPSTAAAEVAKEPSPEVYNSSNTVSVATGADDEPTDDVKELKEEDKAEVTQIQVAYPPYKEEEEKENHDVIENNDALEDGEIRDDSPSASAAASDSIRPPPESQGDSLVEDPVDNVEAEPEPVQPAEPAIVAPATTDEPIVVLKTVEARRGATSTTTSPLKTVKEEVVDEQPVQPAPDVEAVQPVQQPAVVDVVDEPVVVRTPSRTPSRTPVRTTRRKSVKREEIDEDEDIDEYTPSTSTRPVRRRSVKREYWEEMDVKPSAYDLVKSCSRSCRIKDEPMDDEDIKHQRFLRCDSEYSHCPECGDEVGRLTMGRRMHYRRVHYPIFYRLEKGMGDIERWVSSRIGAFSGTPATEKDGRICLMCNDVNDLHNGRIPLLKHIQQTHKAEYKQLKEDYRLYSREKQRKPEDLDVHRKLL